MPVVVRFQSKLEMAPILVGENLLRRVVADPTLLGQIDKAVGYWNGKYEGEISLTLGDA